MLSHVTRSLRTGLVRAGTGRSQIRVAQLLGGQTARFSNHSFHAPARHLQQGNVLSTIAKRQASTVSVSALNTAVAAGDLEKAQKWVAQGCDVNVGDYDGRTPLHVAASFNNVEMAKWLVAQGAVLREDHSARLPIHDALQYRNAEMKAILDACKYEHDRDFSDCRHPDKIAEVFERVARHGLFTVDALEKKLRYFSNDLGLGDDYFAFSAQEIAEQFHSFAAACITARTSRNAENVCVEAASDDDAVILFTDCNKLSVQGSVEKFMMDTPTGTGVNLRYMRSKASATEDLKETLNVYHVTRSPYVTATGSTDDETATTSDSVSITEIATESFLKNTDKAKIARIQKLLEASKDKPYATTQTSQIEYRNEPYTEILFAVPTGTIANDAVFLRSISDTVSRLGHRSEGGGVDKFANGTAVYAINCKGFTDKEAVDELKSYANLAFTQFRSPLFENYAEREISGRQLLYFHAACRFTHYFEYEKNEDLDDLYKSFKDNPMMLDRVATLDKSLGNNLHTLPELYSCVQKHHGVAQELYADFSRRFTGELEGYEYQDIELLLGTVKDPTERLMLSTIHLFNQSVTATNLWKSTKAAANFRMNPQVILGNQHVPEIPYAIFMVLGLDFTGFHVRFRDISRGGVRLIKSTPENYEANRKIQFLENFNLAYTQKLKNKDIPESGSKGTILMKQGRNDREKLAFKQYVDSMMDIMLKAEGVVDLEEKPEFIFLGPDENTAGFMDDACLYAKERGYDFWRAFTTGKGPMLGGIPHDTYGMTTRSVRSFSKGVMRRLGLKEENVTKFMTGGPDGDLGSNEILMGKECVVGVVDGSGVLYDPNGIDDAALKALATDRFMVSRFDQKLLSEKGFFASATQQDVTLRDGTHVKNGFDFRNNFHLWDNLQADFFVPCGGRPESIHKNNVAKILLPDGTPRFKYIIEGANLFITEHARNFIQDHDVLLFKDASTNKGGVTSSSLEVLAGLAMTDEEFAEHMQATGPNKEDVPEFYARYVEQVIETVEANATNEFEYIYAESQKSGRRSTEITRLLSEEMNKLNDMITHSDLFDSEALRRKVLQQSIPSVLQEQVGLDNIMARVPPQYQRAIFAMYLSSRFVYENGSDVSTYNFYKFMQRFQTGL